MEQNRMAGFMIGRNFLFRIGNDTASLLRTDSHLNKGSLDVLLGYEYPVGLRRQNGRFIQKVCQICAGKARGSLGHLLQVHIIGQRLISCVQLQDIFPAAHVRGSHADFPVKTSGTQNRGIEYIHAVGGRHNDNSFIHAEAVHLHQQLVQRLLPFIVAASHTGSPASCHGVNFINKYDTGRIFLRFFKQVADSGSAHADKHFHEIRS